MRKLEKMHMLDSVYVVAIIVCLGLTIGGSVIDIASIIINAMLFIIVFVIFYNARKAIQKIGDVTKDLQQAIEKIKKDSDGLQENLWMRYIGSDEELLFQNEELRCAYQSYVKERKKLAAISEKYKSAVSDYINEAFIDSMMKKNVYNLVPGVMTGLGILGTFIGLSLALQQFSTGSAQEIEASIVPLMQGIKVAFHSSIYGMWFSLWFNFIYKETLEDAYIAVDEFLEVFDKYVDSNASNNNEIVIQNLLEKMPEAIGENIANIFSPIAERMNTMFENLTNNIAETQVQGVAEIVDHLIGVVNDSMGDSFKSFRETMDKSIEQQIETGKVMDNVLNEVKNMTNDIMEINELSNNTINHMYRYVEKLDVLQGVLNDNFVSIKEQLEYQKEYEEKLKEYIDILVNYEHQIGEASTRFTEDICNQLEYLGTIENKISESARENLEMLAVKADEYNKSLTDAAKQELSSVTSVTKEYSEHVKGYVNELEAMSDKFTEKSADNIQLLYENAQMYNESARENLEMLAVNADKYNKSLTDAAKQELSSAISVVKEYSEHVKGYVNELEAMSNKVTEKSADNVQLLYEKARMYNQTLAEEANKHMSNIITISSQQTDSLDRASKNLADASKELNDKIIKSLNRAFVAIDENLAEITRHLSGTISEIEDTTERVPKIVQASYDGMKTNFDEMKEKYIELVGVLDSMVHTIEKYTKND